MTTRLRRAVHELLRELRELPDPITGEPVDEVVEALEESEELTEDYSKLNPHARSAVRSRENLCVRCLCQPACIVAQLQPVALEIVVYRCLGFTEIQDDGG